MITAKQLRAARALLSWSQSDLGKQSGIAVPTIANIETESTVARKDTLAALQKTLEDNGIEFLPGNGVREKDKIITVYEGDEAEEQLLNDIYETMLKEGEGSEVLIYGLEEMDPKKEPQAFALAKAQLDRLAKAGVTERILGREGNTHFIAPWHSYRWVPAENGFKTPFFIYGTKIALNKDTSPYKSIVIDDYLFADTCRHLFNFAWNRALIPPLPKEI